MFMKLILSATVGLMTVAAQAQIGGGGLSGVGTGSYGGALIARVSVAPVGGFGFQGGAFAGQGGGLGSQGGGGGLYGVTRPTFMGERNIVAAQFFNSAGVRLPVPAAGAPGGTTAGGAFFAGGRVTTQPANQVAVVDSTEPSTEPAAVQPAMPFAPPPIASKPSRAAGPATSVAAAARPPRVGSATR